MIKTPVIFLIYRRPDLVRRSLACLAAVRPANLYVVADGPKNEEEKELTEKCRAVVRDGIDWDCEVRWNMADENMGLADRVSSGISWAFESCESAIILEEDCLPKPAFFGFCEIVLNRFKEDETIFAVSGDNFQGGKRRGEGDYYFSVYPHCWGWATWKRAWNHYDHGCPPMTESEIADSYGGGYLSSASVGYWARNFDAVATGKVDSWAYRWQQAIWRNAGKIVLPQVNLVENVGVGEDASNTAGSVTQIASSGDVHYEKGTFRDPEHDELCREADDYTAAVKFGLGLSTGPIWFRAYRKLYRIAYRVLPVGVKERLRGLRHLRRNFALGRLSRRPRYVAGSTRIPGTEVFYTDPASFVSAFREIFVREIYRFESEAEHPRILDAGANLGLASLYLKQKFPGARITAFEPDPGVAEACRRNFASAGHHDIELVEAALGREEGRVTFFQEGADGGRIEKGENDWDANSVEMKKLSDFIVEPIDFLKLDIEGAELDVLREIEPKLAWVKRIFCEHHDFVRQPQTLAALLEIFERSGFRYYIESGMHREQPLMKSKPYNGMDHFAQIYAWRSES